MTTSMANAAMPASPLEDFLRDYVETIGGAWDEVEPQVYDLLLPGETTSAVLDVGGRGIVRVAFDPEAVPEHPGAQLASFGTPLVDRVLADALERARFAEFYVVGLNLTPHDLAGRVRKALPLAPDLRLRLERFRPMHFPQALFWFEASFISDQKEQEIVPVAMDLHYERQVRHLERLLDHARLADRPALPLAEARRASAARVYPVARERALRTFASMANTRGRELSERLERQIVRMTRYYADLRGEVQEQFDKAQARSEDTAKFTLRREALEREERLRVAELRQKNSLRVRLRLLNLLVIQQPKLLLHCVIESEKASAALELVWDPLLDVLEAPPCPVCTRPSFSLVLDRQGHLACASCADTPPVKGRQVQKR